MIAPNYSKFCVEAERYYYDFLSDESGQPVPDEVFNHIILCDRCREQINHLETLLAKCEEKPHEYPAQSRMAIAAILKLHFSYAGKRVTCGDVKPFLPSLLNPALRIEIPTPITVHLHKCEQCREDLKKLQGLDLSPKNLAILGQMFADDLAIDESICVTVRTAIPSVVAMAFNQTDAKNLKHLCLCPKCREELYKFREVVLQQTASQRGEDSTGNKKLYCPSVTSNDIFDYCIPYNIDPASDEYAKFRKSLTTHIVCCADCLDKIQQLHRTIYGIIDRPESGIATIFHLDKSAETQPQVELDDPYAGFPIKVEVADLETVQAGRERSYEEFKAPVKLKSISENLRPLLKIALPVAAVIVVGVSLLLNTPFAKALTIEQIQEAILKVKNVHIASFVPETANPIQEKWVSRTLNIYMTSTGNELAIWDLHRGIHSTRVSGTGKTRQVSLSAEETTTMEAITSSSFGLMPVEDMSALPKDSQWIQLADASIAGDISALEVYDLLWAERTSLASNKWRVYVDPETKLPQKTEFYQMLPDEEVFVLKSFKVIDYPTDDEMKAMIEKLSF